MHIISPKVPFLAAQGRLAKKHTCDPRFAPVAPIERSGSSDLTLFRPSCIPSVP
jgi:hypothetical protein